MRTHRPELDFYDIATEDSSEAVSMDLDLEPVAYEQLQAEEIIGEDLLVVDLEQV